MIALGASDRIFLGPLLAAKPLPEITQRHLLRQSASGDQLARRMLLETNSRIVAKALQHYRDVPHVAGGPEAADLFQVGAMGLLHAIDNFDHNAGAKFSTYATLCVHGYIKTHLSSRRLQISVPVKVQSRLKQLATAVDSEQFSSRSACDPATVAAALSITERQASHLTHVSSVVASLDERRSSEDADPFELRGALDPRLERSACQARALLTLRHEFAISRRALSEALGMSMAAVARAERAAAEVVRGSLDSSQFDLAAFTNAPSTQAREQLANIEHSCSAAHKAIALAFLKLGPRRQVILTLHLGRGYSIASIAKHFGCSHKQAQERIRSALSKLSDLCGDVDGTSVQAIAIALTDITKTRLSAIETFENTERKLLSLRLIDGLPIESTAARLSISQKKAVRIDSRARAQLTRIERAAAVSIN